MFSSVSKNRTALFRSIPQYAKGKKIGFGSALFFALSTILFAVTGRLTHTDGFYDASIATGAATFIAGVVAAVCTHSERAARTSFIKPLHDEFIRCNTISDNNL